MQSTTMVVFERKDTATLLRQFGFGVRGTKKNSRVLLATGEKAVCGSCRKDLHVHNVGNIAPGSRLLFCDNPMCFSSWVASEKVRPE